MIIKNVPFVDDKKQKYASCQGPPTVMMILKYFDINLSFLELYKKMDYKKGKWFFETYIVKFLNSLNIPCKYYSDYNLKKISNNLLEFERVSNLKFNEKNKKEIDVKHYDEGVNFVLKNKLFRRRKLDLKFIIEQIKKNKLIIAVVNRNILTNKKGYKGHFILIKGFDKKNIICNDSYLGENLIIPIKKFKTSFYYLQNKKKTHHLVVIG